MAWTSRELQDQADTFRRRAERLQQVLDRARDPRPRCMKCDNEARYAAESTGLPPLFCGIHALDEPDFVRVERKR